MRILLSRWKQLRQHRCVEGLVIPPETRVDPSRFPEIEFPVRCPQCDYPLWGLPECRCPECGRPFDRGRLLVEQYVIEEGRWHTAGVGRWSRWLFVVGFVLAIGPMATHFALMLVGRTGVLPSRFVLPAGMEWMLFVGLAPGFALMLVATILRACAKFSTLTKSRRVLKAIDLSDPAIRRAQVLRPVSLGFWPFLVALVFPAAITFNWLAHPGGHTRHSFRDLVTTLVVAAAILGFAYAAMMLRHPRKGGEEPDRRGG